MVSERIHDSSQAPAILVADGRNNRAPSGSSTVITILTDPPPRDSGLKLKCSGDSSASQNSAVPTDNRATTSPLSLSTRNNSTAPNAALQNSIALTPFRTESI